MDTPPSASPSSRYLGLTVVLCFFCVPLFLELAGWDLQSDEALYSYAVDRILETGDWLTPRTIPYDGPFLEKPPLKLWMVAGAIAAGLLPHDEFGLRFLDALFGAVAFLYVFWLGLRLAGPVAGVAAVLVLFTFQPLLFEHGLRSNNMDAALVLSFCGGVHHFARWVESSTARSSTMHALAFAAYFTLGFMTKFVAALFLPVVCAVAFAWRPDAGEFLRSRWRDWIVPLLTAVAAIAPWFVYQAVHTRNALWKTMFEIHVYERFTGALDLRHLEPWHFYYSTLWRELVLAGSHWIAIAGICLLAAKAWKGDWLAKLLLAWCLLPFAVISIGTSKIFHYAYPFLPPLALGAGAAAAALFGVLKPKVSVVFQSTRWPGYSREAWRNGIALAMVAIVLPCLAYAPTVQRILDVRHPLRSFRDCALSLQTAPSRVDVYVPYDQLATHSMFYYLRRIGAWTEHAQTNELKRRISDPEGYDATLLPRSAYWMMKRDVGLPAGVTTWAEDPNVILTTPRLDPCTRAVMDSGGSQVGSD